MNNERYKYYSNSRRSTVFDTKQYGQLSITSSKNAGRRIRPIQRKRQQICGRKYLRNPGLIYQGKEQRRKRSGRRRGSNTGQTI